MSEPFDKNQISNDLYLIGSKNQKFNHLTNAFIDIKGKENSFTNKYEVRISPNGHTTMNGMSNTYNVHSLLNDITKNG